MPAFNMMAWLVTQVNILKGFVIGKVKQQSQVKRRVTVAVERALNSKYNDLSTKVDESRVGLHEWP